MWLYRSRNKATTKSAGGDSTVPKIAMFLTDLGFKGQHQEEEVKPPATARGIATLAAGHLVPRTELAW